MFLSARSFSTFACSPASSSCRLSSSAYSFLSAFSLFSTSFLVSLYSTRSSRSHWEILLMYSALFSRSAILLASIKISRNSLLPFSYIYLIRSFIVWYWSSSLAFAVTSSVSASLISVSFAVRSDCVFSIFDTMESSSEESSDFSASAVFFCCSSSGCFFFASEISSACAGITLLKQSVNASNAPSIFFPLIIFVSLKYYATRLLSAF